MKNTRGSTKTMLLPEDLHGVIRKLADETGYPMYWVVREAIKAQATAIRKGAKIELLDDVS